MGRRLAALALAAALALGACAQAQPGEWVDLQFRTVSGRATVSLDASGDDGWSAEYSGDDLEEFTVTKDGREVGHGCIIDYAQGAQTVDEHLRSLDDVEFVEDAEDGICWRWQDGSLQGIWRVPGSDTLGIGLESDPAASREDADEMRRRLEYSFGFVSHQPDGSVTTDAPGEDPDAGKDAESRGIVGLGEGNVEGTGEQDVPGTREEAGVE